MIQLGLPQPVALLLCIVFLVTLQVGLPGADTNYIYNTQLARKVNISNLKLTPNPCRRLPISGLRLGSLHITNTPSNVINGVAPRITRLGAEKLLAKKPLIICSDSISDTYDSTILQLQLWANDSTACSSLPSSVGEAGKSHFFMLATLEAHLRSFLSGITFVKTSPVVIWCQCACWSYLWFCKKSAIAR